MPTVLKPAQNVSEVTTPPTRYRKFARRSALLAPETFWPALKQAFVMLRPDIQWKNPVMFVVEIGAFLTLFYLVQAALGKSESQVSTGYFVGLDIWLFLTVLFANFATSELCWLQSGLPGWIAPCEAWMTSWPRQPLRISSLTSVRSKRRASWLR